MSEHSAASLIRTIVAEGTVKKPHQQKSQIVAVLDTVNAVTLDSTADANKVDVSDLSVGAAYSAESNLRVSVAATIQEWLETDDLDEGETLADRLLMLFVGIVDANQDGELDEDETLALNAALEAAWDYLSEKGVSDEDCSLLLNDWDADAAGRISDIVASTLPDGEDAADADIDSFAFGDDEQEAALDSATLDAVYKKMVAIRRGKKVRINKRVSGHVRLSAKQKVSIRKAQLKSHSARAIMRRMKSRRIGRRMGV